MTALAVFFTLAFGIGMSYRVSTDYDPTEGMPSGSTLCAIGIVALAAWLNVAAP